MEKIFSDGIWFNLRRKDAPEWVVGGLSVDLKRFNEWAQNHLKEGKVRLSILLSKEGKPYCQLDTWEPKEKGVDEKMNNTYKNVTKDSPNPDDIPF